MNKELTSEEIVTEILTSNQIINSDSKNSYIPNNDGSLGEYLVTAPIEHSEPKEISRYTFIDTSLNWGF